VRLGLKPEINALATLFMVAVGVVVVAVNRMQIQAAKRAG
jgi:putrescine transport system permease protein